MKPLIGITCGLKDGAEPEFYLHTRYVASVEAAGALPVIIPVTVESTLLRLLARLDGIVIIGGPDLPPEYYGEDNNGSEALVPLARAESDLAIARYAEANDVPFLGICYGHQVLNVALGGTLIQDIPRAIPKPLKHRKLTGESRAAIHEVSLLETSRLAQVLGATKFEAASSHHQSVRDAGRGLRVVAYAEDEVIEATEHPERNFLISVQWHPEMTPEAEHSQKLFAALVEAATKQAV